jgi:hypothetical protein
MQNPKRGPMFKTATRSTLLLLALLLPACSAPTASTTLSVNLTGSPDPTTATPSQGVTYTITNPDSTTTTKEYQYQTSFSVTLQETGGTQLNITALNLVVQQASGGIVITPSGGDKEYYRFNSSAPTNVLDAHGTISIGFQVWYSLPSGGKEALITVTFGFTDNNSNSYSKTVQVKVAP